MLKLRRGDVWKAVALCVLIGATAWFIMRTLRQVSHPQVLPVAAPPRAEPSQAAATKEMFAPRTRTIAGLARARSAPDPFHPLVSNEVVSVRQSRPTDRLPSPPPSLSPELAELRLTGTISGTRPMAVLRQGDKRYFLRSGDALPGGWRIVQIEARGVTVAKGNERVQLRVSKGGTGA